MAQIPEDMKAGIEALSKAKDTPIKDLLARLKEIINEDENLKAMENDNFKIRVAWAALYKEYSSAQGQECLISPLLHCSVNYYRDKDDKNTGVTNLNALVKPLKNEKGEEIEYQSQDEGWQYAAGTLFRDAAISAGKLEVGKVYNTTVILSNTYGEKGKKRKERDWGLGIIANNAKFSVTKEKVPDFKKFYEDEIEDKNEIMSLSDTDMNESAHDTDIRVVRIQIMDEDINEREDGTEYAYYDIMDNSISGETRRFFIDVRDYKYMQGSVLLAGVTVRNTAKKDEEPIFRMNPQWFIPEIAEEITFESKKSDNTEEIVIDEPEKEEKTETKTEEKSDEESASKGGEEHKKEKEEGDLFEI